MDVLAQRLGASRFEFEKLLGQAIEKGLVSGVVDRAHDEFVLKEGETPSVFVGKCPWCGGDVNKWAFPEEVWTCPYCERSVTTPSTSLEASNPETMSPPSA